jgi:hypothetical protein
MPISNTLTEQETQLWESDSPEAARFRAKWRKDAISASYALNGASIELYSHDGIMLDSVAWSE